MKDTYIRETLAVKVSHVFPPDTNNHHTLFGGKLMSYIDDIASISAMRHSRSPVVTASTDSVDFLAPIRTDESVCLESCVTWTGTSSMEVFVKVLAENLITGQRTIAATAFLTFVAVNDEGRSVPVANVIPETEEEKYLHETAKDRVEARKRRKQASQELANFIHKNKPWE
ncbi:acyl-CoA thioester hydrolase [Gracilibacillus halophilus YIM-C55.5]|uniref:Acyl-CoA thioester hydrolase n=1 Tax=Gracilibacillus halophilus YIM-C55.5 TaxID=1308866 RepID=N4WYM9_9BACI|nr:acyl-CoA thioesterase [Gracilibacillus halophilus]ENH98146.1 acyl-CoA thioester hydrolase [Gracilibacillus halophilus YIM-C55.5]